MSSVDLGNIGRTHDLTQQSVVDVTHGNDDNQQTHTNSARQSLLTTIMKIVEFINKEIKKNVWEPFVKNATKLGREILRVSLILGKPVAELAGKVKEAIAALGLVNLITAAFIVFGIPFVVKEAVDKSKIGDTEGVVRASVGGVMDVTDAISNLSTALNSMSALGAVIAAPALAFFSVVGLPLAIAGLGYAAIKGTYDVVQNSISLHEMYKELKNLQQAQNVDQLKDYIDRKLGVTQDENNALHFEAKQVSICERRSDKKVVKLMKELRAHLEENNDVATAQLALEHMKGLMWRKIGINTSGVIMNAALCAVLIATLVYPAISPIVVPVVGGAKALVGLGRSGLNIALDKWDEKWYQANKNSFTAAAAA
jgi:hypothetical protein